MDTELIPPKLAAIFREELHNPTLELHSAMTPDETPGWDSTSMVGIIMAIEEEFGIEFDAAELKGVTSVGDIARIIHQRRD